MKPAGSLRCRHGSFDTRSSTRRAQRLAGLQMEFVAGVSHELRTPLSVVRTAAHNLAEGVIRDADEMRSYGVLIEDEIGKLTSTVEQVLRFSRLESVQSVTPASRSTLTQ